MKNDFIKDTKDKLCAEVGGRCSNPSCRAPTKGGGGSKGEAAHITAASQGGLRHDGEDEQCHSHENGIWLCANCHTLIDNKPFEDRYTVELLMEWKKTAIEKARLELERGYISDDPFFNLRLGLDCTIHNPEKDIYLIQANLINKGDTSFELKPNYISHIMVGNELRNSKGGSADIPLRPNESIMVNHTDIIIGGGLWIGDNLNAYVRVTFDYPGYKTIEYTSSVGEIIEKSKKHMEKRYG